MQLRLVRLVGGRAVGALRQGGLLLPFRFGRAGGLAGFIALARRRARLGVRLGLFFAGPRGVGRLLGRGGALGGVFFAALSLLALAVASALGFLGLGLDGGAV